MPDCCPNLLFSPVDVASPALGGLQGGHGNADVVLGAVPALCGNSPHVIQQKCLLCLWCTSSLQG